MNPELLVDALADWAAELRVLKMLLVVLLSDHHIDGSVGFILFPWRFELDRVISDAALRDRLSIAAGAGSQGGCLVRCLVAPLFAASLSVHYYANTHRHPLLLEAPEPIAVSASAPSLAMRAVRVGDSCPLGPPHPPPSDRRDRKVLRSVH